MLLSPQILARRPKPIVAAGDSAAYTNFIARTSLTAPTDNTYLAAYKALLDGLTTDGLFNSDGTSTYLDVLVIFATKDTATALLNIPSATYTLTPVNSPTFTADRGYTGNGSNQTIGTSFNPATAGGAFAQNSAHASVWNLSNISDANPALGEANNNPPLVYPKFNGNNSLFVRITDNTEAGYAITDPRGLVLGSRTASNLTTGYFNGVSQGTASDASAALNSANVAILADGNTGFSSYQLAAVSLGGGLNGTQVTNFYNRLRTYMTAVGVP